MDTDTLILLVGAVVLVLLVGAGLAIIGAADYRKAKRRELLRQQRQQPAAVAQRGIRKRLRSQLPTLKRGLRGRFFTVTLAIDEGFGYRPLLPV